MQGKYTRLNIMIDIEGLRLNEAWKTPLMQVAAMLFDEEGNEVGYQDWYIDPEETFQYGFSVEPSTLMWWEKQDYWEELCSKCKFSSRTTEYVLKQLYNYIHLNQVDKVWFNHPTYDETVLKQYYRVMGLPLPWKHNQVMDMATLVNYVGRPTLEAGMKHNAVEDCRYQVNCLKHVYNVTGIPLK